MHSSRPALILPLLLSITSVMFVVLTICGLTHVLFPASTQDITTKGQHGCIANSSYEQSEWLRNTPLVKSISRLVSQSKSVARHAAMT